MHFQLPLRYLYLSCVTNNAYFKRSILSTKYNTFKKIHLCHKLSLQRLSGSLIHWGWKCEIIFIFPVSTSAITISSVSSFPRILFKAYSQNLVFLTSLIYATTSLTYSLLTIHAASGYFYSIKSNFCSNIDLPKVHFLSHYASGQKVSMALRSKTKPNFLSYHSIPAYSRNQCRCIFFTLILMNYYYFQQMLYLFQPYAICHNFPIGVLTYSRWSAISTQSKGYNNMQNNDWMSNKIKF